MAARSRQTAQQALRIDYPLPHEDLKMSTDKVDCERVALGQDIRSNSSWQSRRMYLRLLRLVGFLGVALFLQRFWPAKFLHDCFHGWRSETTLALDDFCPQVEALTLSEHEDLLKRLDEEFRSNEFRLKAYESLGGAVRIPCVFFPLHYYYL